ncbi:MAG: MarR family winged helix-turn-helix transcriptional regulator [Pseudomonadota bacterium]
MENETENAPLQLSKFLPYRLSVLSNTVSSGIAADYQRAFGLNLWQWRVMAVVGECEGLTAREITQRTAMDKVAVSRAVTALEARGFLCRQVDPEDARSSHLGLTQAGQDVYQQIVPLALNHETILLRALSPQEEAILERLLEKLARAASPDHPLW